MSERALFLPSMGSTLLVTLAMRFAFEYVVQRHYDLMPFRVLFVLLSCCC
jgi:hypothetical protein